MIVVEIGLMSGRTLRLSVDGEDPRAVREIFTKQIFGDRKAEDLIHQGPHTFLRSTVESITTARQANSR